MTIQIPAPDPADDPDCSLTELMNRMNAGDKEAESRVYELVYGTLKGLAAGFMRRQSRDHSLWVTDVVHGAYAKLYNRAADWTDRRHFYCVASRAMEQLLVDHARRKNALRRKATGRRVPLDATRPDDGPSIPERVANVLDVHAALEALEEACSRAARIVRLRYFTHLSVARVATTMAMPKRTVERDIAYGLAWICHWLSKDEGDEAGAPAVA